MIYFVRYVEKPSSELNDFGQYSKTQQVTFKSKQEFDAYLKNPPDDIVVVARGASREEE